MGIPSTRGLVDSGGPNTPLRHFKGELVSAAEEEYTREGDTKPRKRAALNLKDLQVLVSTEPYPYPTATIKLNMSNRYGSGWGIFSKTLNLIIPQTEDLENQVGKVLELKWVAGRDESGAAVRYHELEGLADKDLPPDANGKYPNRCISAWEVVSVNGAMAGEEARTVQDELADILDGKSLPEFTSAALQSQKVKTDAEAVKAVTVQGDANFANAMVTAGKFALGEDGKYRKVA